MKVLVVLATLLACSLADRQHCPHIQDADRQLVDQTINLSPPLEGVEAIEIDVADVAERDAVSCVTMISHGEGGHGGPAALSFGRNRRGGLGIQIVSGERSALHASIQAYGPGRNPGPNPGPGPNNYYKPIPARFL